MENGWSEKKSDNGGENKLYPSVDTVIPIKDSRAAKNDLIICYTKKNPSDENKITTKRFEVEKAVLACHSAFFENTFDVCDDSNDESQIQLPEQADVVETFLNCIYGIDSEIWSFDLCIDIIDMARNYEAKIVERQAYFRFCAAFEELSKKQDEISTYTRYGRLYILKFMLNLHQAIKDDFIEASFLLKAFKERSTSILNSCGMEITTTLRLERQIQCRHGHQTSPGIDPNTISGAKFAINQIFTQEERSHFSINELLEFKLCLILHATSPPSTDIFDSFRKESF